MRRPPHTIPSAYLPDTGTFIPVASLGSSLFYVPRHFRVYNSRLNCRTDDIMAWLRLHCAFATLPIIVAVWFCFSTTAGQAQTTFL